MSAFSEQPNQERPIAYVRRRKSGLETPLVGRFYREGRVLVFAPPLWYDILVIGCIAGGALFTLAFLWDGGEQWQLFTSVAVALAGLWALASNERMICDIRKGTYTRFEGGGIAKHLVRGSLSELDALVLTSEQYAPGAVLTYSVLYRLVLHWKGARQPPLPVEKEQCFLPPGAVLNQGAGSMLARGAAYAKALDVRYYDNSHLYGKSPVSVV